MTFTITLAPWMAAALLLVAMAALTSVPFFLGELKAIKMRWIVYGILAFYVAIWMWAGLGLGLVLGAMQ
jgi:hypothetical protein